MIDADELYARLMARYTAHNLDDTRDMAARAAIMSCMEAVERSKTIATTQPPNDPLTPEELREMGKDWVWTKLLVPHYGMYTGYYIKHPKVPDRDSFQCGYPNIWVQGLPYSLYGDTWLAYRCKPEEGTA